MKIILLILLFQFPVTFIFSQGLISNTTNASRDSLHEFPQNSNSQVNSPVINKAYGDNLKDMGDGNFAIFSGDTNQNGIIDSGDILSIGNAAKFFITGYHVNDITGDGIIESVDLSLTENNFGKIVLRP